MTTTRARAVRFDRYGGPEVLYVTDVELPPPPPGEVLVEVRAAGINPGESGIRTGALAARFPAVFPEGEGSDLAGVVRAVGEGVTDRSVGDEVLGWSWRRSSHASHVLVPADQLVAKPAGMSWEVAGSLYVVACTAYAAVRAVGPRPGETVAVSAAAGGVGALVVQLLRRRGATVLGLASERNAGWLRGHGAVPVAHGDGVADRLRAAAPRGIDAFVDCFGGGYVQLALELGVARDRVDTIIDFDAAEELGVKAEGSMHATTPEVLAEMAGLVADGLLEFPVAATYPLEQVRAAFTELDRRHTHGKIVLLP
jgi:NADPH:quinone reductase